MFETLAAAASVTPKGEGCNEDRVAVFEAAAEPAGSGAVVCDGVGSLAGSASVAERYASHVAEQLAARGVVTGMCELDRIVAEAPPPGQEGATTLLAVGAERPGLVAHALVGNGSVLVIEPWEPHPGLTRLRWVELALSQMSWDEGRPALRSVLPAAGAVELALGVRRAVPGRAQMYLACSDGVASEEDRAQARTPDGSLWREVPRALAQVLEALAASWPQLLAGSAPEAGALLEQTLAQTLARLRDERGLDDDASVGAVLLRPVPQPHEEVDPR